jgi:hypothetical protein
MGISAGNGLLGRILIRRGCNGRNFNYRLGERKRAGQKPCSINLQTRFDVAFCSFFLWLLKRSGAFGARGSSQDLDRLGLPAQREGAPYIIILSHSKRLPQKGFATAYLLGAACIFWRDPVSLACSRPIPERDAERRSAFRTYHALNY